MLGTKLSGAVFPYDRERFDLPLGIQSDILRERYLCLIGVAFAGTVCLGVPAGESISLIGEGISLQRRLYTGDNFLGRGLVGAIVGNKGYGTSGYRIQRPLAAFIAPGIPGYSIRCFHIRAISITQLGRGDGNLMGSYFGTALGVLVSNRLFANGAFLFIHACTGAGADIRAAFRGIQGSIDGQRTVDVQPRVNKVIFGTVIRLAWGIAHSLEFQAIGITIAAPFILVIGIDGNAVGDHQVCAACDVGLNAGQKRCGLVHRQFAALRQIDRHIVGDGQDIILGVDRRTCQLQIQVIDLRLAVDRIKDAVSRAVIHFGQAAGDNFEHAAVSDKGDGRGIDPAAGINRRIRIFRRALLKRHCGLHILDVVLAEGEYLVADTHGCAAAAEIQDLIPFIDVTAGFHRNRTCAGNKAPGIQIAAALYRNITARIQPDLAVITGHVAVAAAGSGLILTANAEAALHREGNALGKRQGFEFILFRSCLFAWCQSSGSRREQRFCRVMRNQQRNPGRNRAVLCQRRFFALKRDLGYTVFLRVSDRLAQIFEYLRSRFKQARVLGNV